MPLSHNPTLHSPTTLVVIGDSTAASRGAAHSTIADMVATHLRRRGTVDVHVVAVAGSRTRDVLRHQVPLVSALRPTIVLIGLGANDVLRSRLGERLSRETRSIIRTLREQLPDALIVHTGSPPMDTIPRIPRLLRQLVRRRTDRVNAVIEHSCQREGAVFVPLAATLRAAYAEGDDLFSTDRFHVNDKGYRLSADLICHILDEHRPKDARAQR